MLVEPPQPEEKLAMLSEIAQEHGVEWWVWLLSWLSQLLTTGVGVAVAEHWGGREVGGRFGVHGVHGVHGAPWQTLSHIAP